jgi:hypothetical protein
MTVVTEVFIDSSRRKSNSVSSTNFEYDLGRCFNNIKKAVLHWCVIPITIYNITSSNNKCIISGTNDSNEEIVVPPGCYSASALALYLTTKLNEILSGGTYTFACSYDSTALKFRFTTDDSDFELKLSGDDSLYRVLGFNKSTYSGTSIVSERVISLEQPTMLNLSIRELDTQCLIGNQQIINSSWLIRLHEQGGGINIWDLRAITAEHVLEDKRSTQQAFDTLHVKLTDLDGHVVNLNEAEWGAFLTLHQ